jgi:hypothetical protein
VFDPNETYVFLFLALLIYFSQSFAFETKFLLSGHYWTGMYGHNFIRFLFKNCFLRIRPIWLSVQMPVNECSWQLEYNSNNFFLSVDNWQAYLPGSFLDTLNVAGCWNWSDAVSEVSFPNIRSLLILLKLTDISCDILVTQNGYFAHAVCTGLYQSSGTCTAGISRLL